MDVDVYGVKPLKGNTLQPLQNGPVTQANRSKFRREGRIQGHCHGQHDAVMHSHSLDTLRCRLFDGVSGLRLLTGSSLVRLSSDFCQNQCCLQSHRLFLLQHSESRFTVPYASENEYLLSLCGVQLKRSQITFGIRLGWQTNATIKKYVT
ncbi:hypothetical protein TNIN_175591 [Trichonephila inaurata madagascariensis]|uniref:Uncharacterized protein n=1 Tax=Trichonephila inaurata madagascariensis TaxID=2747483 RepID=A0A8X6XKG3_9ARAC|nr:hypothetical protein TNIN_175591 [Trichonephila inaurata madagascariensis]